MNKALTNCPLPTCVLLVLDINLGCGVGERFLNKRIWTFNF